MKPAPTSLHSYRAPRWLPGGNLQTIWPAKLSRHHLGARPAFERQRWATPDGDFIDVDRLVEFHDRLVESHDQLVDSHHQLGDSHDPLVESHHPLVDSRHQRAEVKTQLGAKLRTADPRESRRHLVLFHGLEGSSASPYAQAFANVAQQRGWDYSVPHFRGCSGEINLAPRAYHSGDFEEIGWILRRLRAGTTEPLLVVGISLGGNALLRWAEESGAAAAAVAGAVAAVSSPVDLTASGAAIDRGFNRLVYATMFLRTMKPRALAKLQQHPGLFDRDKLAAARTLFEFDNVFTAPLHGYRDTADYWSRASAKPGLADVRIPALVLNAGNDPFVPAASLPRVEDVGKSVTLWQPPHGGHVGFPGGLPPGHTLTMPQAVASWLAQHG